MQNFYRLRQEKSLSKGEALRQAQLMLLRGEVQGAPSNNEEKRNSILHRSDGNTLTPSTPFVYDETKPFAHPFYWAPFFLTGNWR